MAAYDRHLKRKGEDAAYSDRVDYGHTGGTADANPWALGDEQRAARNDGWRVGTAQRSFDATRDAIASEFEIERYDRKHGTAPEGSSGGLWGSSYPQRHGNDLFSSGADH